MSRENVEIMRHLTHATRQDDLATAWASVTELLDPEIEMDTTRIAVPGLAGVYTGLEEVGRWWLDWAEAWGSLGRVQDPQLTDAGDQVFSWFTQHELRGIGSGIQVEMPEYGWVVTVRDGRVRRATLYMNRGEALEAAGLWE